MIWKKKSHEIWLTNKIKTLSFFIIVKILNNLLLFITYYYLLHFS